MRNEMMLRAHQGQKFGKERVVEHDVGKLVKCLCCDFAGNPDMTDQVQSEVSPTNQPSD